MEWGSINHFLNFSYTRLEVPCLDFLRELKNPRLKSLWHILKGPACLEKSTWRGLNKPLGSPNPLSASAHGGASRSGTSSHGLSAHGQKRKLPPHQQKKKDSWLKAKQKLSSAEFQQRRKTGSCINCGEQGHIFEACTKPKPS